MKVDIWEDDWHLRLSQRVKSLGYRDVTEFAASSPNSPYRELAAKLGDGIAPVQVEILLRAEAVAADDPNGFSRDCLARYLRQDLPDGWGVGVQPEFNAARAFASWSVALDEGDNAELRLKTQRVWQCLHQLAPNGWKVHGANDPVLIKVFRDIYFEL